MDKHLYHLTRLKIRAKRRLSFFACEWLAANPDTLSRHNMRRWVRSAFDSDSARQMLIHELKELIKASSPPVEELSMDLPVREMIGFENLAGLFSSTTLDEYIITMNVRQAAYLFGLIRQLPAHKVIEIGRHWGGTTVLIAAAMNGNGEFWSIADPRELDWSIQFEGRELQRPIDQQLMDLLSRLGLSANIITADPMDVELETGEVDLVHIDGAHHYRAAMSDFEKFGRRVRVGGALLFDDAVPDKFSDSPHTADVKRVVSEVEATGEFRVARTVKRLMHFERVA